MNSANAVRCCGLRTTFNIYSRCVSTRCPHLHLSERVAVTLLAPKARSSVTSWQCARRFCRPRSKVPSNNPPPPSQLASPSIEPSRLPLRHPALFLYLFLTNRQVTVNVVPWRPDRDPNTSGEWIPKNSLQSLVVLVMPAPLLTLTLTLKNPGILR